MDPNSDPRSTTTDTPQHHPMPGKQHDDIMKFSDHPSFNFPMALGWLVAMFAVLTTLFLWWMSRDAAVQVSEKQDEKSTIMSQIQSPSNVEVEKKASELQASVSALKIARESKFPMSQFLTEFYTKITNDTKIKSIAVTSEGSLNISGTTKSYRLIADLAVALESWDKLAEVQIASSSIEEKEDGSLQATFSITSKINKDKYSTKAETSTSTSTSTSNTSTAATAPAPATSAASVTGGAE